MAAAQADGWRPDDTATDLAGVVWANVHGLADLALHGSLAATVGPDAADRLPSPVHHARPRPRRAGRPPARPRPTVPTTSPPDRPIPTQEPRHDHHDPDVPRRQLRPRHRGGDRPPTCPSPAAFPPSWPAASCASGPTPCRRPTPPTYHWFTGDGMVHGVRLRDGRAEWYRNRWVRGDEVVNTHVIGVDGPHVRPGRGRRPAGRADRRARHRRQLPLRRHARRLVLGPHPPRPGHRRPPRRDLPLVVGPHPPRRARPRRPRAARGADPRARRAVGARLRHHRALRRPVRPAGDVQHGRGVGRRPVPLPVEPRPPAPRRAAAPRRRPRRRALVRGALVLRVPHAQRLRRRARRRARPGGGRRRAPPAHVRHRAQRARRGRPGARAVDARPRDRHAADRDARRPAAGVPPHRRAPHGPAPPLRLRGGVRRGGRARPRAQARPGRRHDRGPRLRPRPGHARAAVRAPLARRRRDPVRSRTTGG